MAHRTRRRGGRRRYRRNVWRGDRFGHSVAAKLGWAYKPRKRRKFRGSPRDYIEKKLGIKKLQRFRKRHPKPSKRRKSFRRMIYFRPSVFGRRYKLVANRRRRRRYADNAPRRRKRRVRRHRARGRGGRFVSRRRRGTRKGGRRKTARRAYRRNWFVYNDNAPRRRRRRRYRRNWFVYNNNPRRRRRRRRGTRKGMRRRTARRAYMRNDVLADTFDTVKSVFDVEFLTGTALPVVGGFFVSRLVSATLGTAALGADYTGAVRHIGDLVSAGLSGAAVGMLLKDPQLAGNVVLGGVVSAVASILQSVAKDVDFIAGSPALSQAFGLSGMGDDMAVRSAVEREVMRELGVSDYLSTEQLSRAENIGGMNDYLTAQQLSRAERVGQYPIETGGPGYLSTMAQYPEETSGGAMADFADVASFS